MGSFDLYCILCGNCNYTPNYLHNEDVKEDLDGKLIPKNFEKELRWLSKCTFLTCDNKIVHNCKKLDDITLVDSQKNKYIMNIRDYFNVANNGIFVHTDCWKFVYKSYGVKLRYSDLPIIHNDTINYIPKINYKEIKDYWSSWFDFVQLIINKDTYICKSPLKDEKNGRRVKHIINQLKIKKNDLRLSPSVSATFYKKGTIKIGNNGKFWIINNGKWIQMKGDIVNKTISVNKSDRNKFNKIPQLGEYNNKPIFVKSFKHDKKLVIFELIELI